MEKLVSAVNKLQEIQQAYEISTEPIERLRQEIASAKVCTPIIGKFSSGKSALVNTALGYRKKILQEDITPETAIPAEIVYTDAEDCITVFSKDGVRENIPVDAYRNYKADANAVKCARIQLRNSFLAEIPDVMLVDMPGFESGFEVHNKAIDNYLPQSLAYIVVFPADDMIVRSSVGNILKELCLHDMPLCVVITKYDKRNPDFDAAFAKLKESLRRFVGDREIRYCKTSSFTGDAEELEEFLKEIQAKSQDMLAHSFVHAVLAIADRTETYLKTRLSSSQLSTSDLDEQEDKLKEQLSGLERTFSTEQANFDKEIAACTEEIKNDVQCALESEEATFVAMAMNQQSINEQLNTVVRTAVTVSVKKKFIPKVEKYLKRVADGIHAEDIGDIRFSFQFDSDKVTTGITSSVVTVAAGVLLGLPILGILAGIVTGIIMKLQGDKKREEAKRKIRMQLQNEVFPQVLKEVGNGIEMAISKQIKLVNTSIEEEIEIQRDTLEKAMADVRGQIQDEKAKKENLAIDMKADLERIGEIRSELS